MNGTNSSAKNQKKSIGYGPVAALIVTISTFIFSHAGLIILLSIIPVLTGQTVEQINHWLDGSIVAKFLSVVFMTLTMLGLVLWFMKRKEVKWPDIGLVWPGLRKTVGYALLGYIMYFLVFLCVSQLVVWLVPGFDINQKQNVTFDTSTTHGVALVLVFLSLAVLPPLAEETIFRGFLYSGLRSRWHKIIAAVVTSVVFAAAHLQWGNGQSLLWVAALDTFVLSLILIYLREKTGSLASSMAVHFIKNSLAFMVLFIVK